MRIGTAPYLDCTSKGDKRFSEYYAKIKSMDNQTIHKLYNQEKIFKSKTQNYAVQNRNGILPENFEEIKKLYKHLWEIYFEENPELIQILINCSGISDMYDPSNPINQSKTLWKIRTKYKETTP